MTGFTTRSCSVQKIGVIFYLGGLAVGAAVVGHSRCQSRSIFIYRCAALFAPVVFILSNCFRGGHIGDSLLGRRHHQQLVPTNPVGLLVGSTCLPVQSTCHYLAAPVFGARNPHRIAGNQSREQAKAQFICRGNASASFRSHP